MRRELVVISLRELLVVVGVRHVLRWVEGVVIVSLLEVSSKRVDV